MDWININTNLGFLIGLIISGLVFLNKNGPNFIKAWHEFTLAMESYGFAPRWMQKETTRGSLGHTAGKNTQNKTNEGD